MLSAWTLAVVWMIPAPMSAQSPTEFGLALVRLELSADLNHEEGSLQAWASYQITNTSEQPVLRVPFNAGRLFTVRSVRALDGTSLDFTQDVVAFTDSPRRQVNHVVVVLPEAVPPGGTVELRIEYGGFLAPYTETGSIYIQDHLVWNAVAPYMKDGRFSILRTDAFAWPVPGTLNAGINRAAPQPDFAFRARISVPEPFVVASAGLLVDRSSEAGRTTFVYESAEPVPFLNLPIAEYTVREGPGVRVYHLPADSAGGAKVLQRAIQGLDLLARWFGPLDRTPDLAVMEIPERWGSQASLTGGIIQTADAFGEARSGQPLYHELSHLWNAKDVDLPSARWNEGLAMFLSLRMAAVLDGSDTMDRDVARTADRLLASASRTQELMTVPFARYGEAQLTDYSYRVGLLMFYSLEAALGAEAFDAFFRDFYQETRSRGWTFSELVGRLRAYPGVDLDEFVHDWIETTAWLEQLQSGVAVTAIGFGGGS